MDYHTQVIQPLHNTIVATKPESNFLMISHEVYIINWNYLSCLIQVQMKEML